MRKSIHERIIKLKSQPRWVVRFMFGIGAMLGLGIAMQALPIKGSMANNEGYTIAFDTNGGSEKESIILGELNNLIVEKYSHTPNISDAGVRNGNYSDDLELNDVITVTGSNELEVTVTYGVESCCDYVVIWEGNHPEYSANNNRYQNLGIKLGEDCEDYENPTTETYTIQGDTVTFGFHSDGSENGYGYYAIVRGKNLGEDPIRDGYVFGGWYMDEELIEPFDYSVTSDITLYAKWLDYYTVTFNTNGSSDIDSQTIVEGEKIVEWFNPRKTGYEFGGWYIDEDLIELFDFENTVITGNVTLHAKWIKFDFEREDITICDPDNALACITMMDRNLGATTAGTGCEYSSLNCREDGWKLLGYNNYNECISEGRIDCGGGDYEGFDTYEECEAENQRLNNQYNECMQVHLGEYGYYYQRGNNYGFNPFDENFAVTDEKAKWNIGYNNYGYTLGKSFIVGDDDYRENNRHYDGLRGGSEDAIENNRGYDVENHVATNVENRQGPCPEGYHVPSVGEWNILLDYYIAENGDENKKNIDNNGLINAYGTPYEACFRDFEGQVDCDSYYDWTEIKYNYIPNFGEKFGGYFKIPFAGHLNPHVGDSVLEYFYPGRDGAHLWTSSPRQNTNAYTIVIGADNISVSPQYYYYNYDRNLGNSIRCFKNIPQVPSNVFKVTFYDGTGENKQEIKKKWVIGGNKVKYVEMTGASHGFRIFDKWYKNPELTIEFDFDTLITSDLDLYAGYVERDTWIDRNGNLFEWNDITICDPEDNSACVTMMDRNLGATTAGTGCGGSSLNCREVGWKDLGYDNYDNCYENMRRVQWSQRGYPDAESCYIEYGNRECSEEYRDWDCWTNSEGSEICPENIDEPYWKIRGYDSEVSCLRDTGGYSCDDVWDESYQCDEAENYEGFDTYEECEAENQRLNDEYNACLQTHSGDYGYYFQWGNNHGFMDINGAGTCNLAKWNIGYNNYGYNGLNFVLGDCGDDYHDDYWKNNQHYDGLRGGSGDSIENNRGYDKENHVATNVENRQGPCPEGYHVPSAGEWNVVSDYYIAENGDKELEIIDDNGLSAGYGVSEEICYSEVCVGDWEDHCTRGEDDEYCREERDDCAWTDAVEVSCEGDYDWRQTVYRYIPNFWQGLQYYFKIPLAGYIEGYYGELQSKNYSNRLRSSSSSPYDYSEALNFYINDSDYFGLKFEYRIYGNSIRCFKNIPDTKPQDEGGNSGSGEGGNGGNAGGGNSGGGSSGGGAGGAGGMTSNNESTTQDPENAVDPDNTVGGHNPIGEFVYDSLKANPNYSDEMNEAYQYAYHYGITTMKNIKEADMGGSLTRIAMAKMLSNYAINVLGKANFNKSRDCSFMDVSPMMDTKYDNGITKACQLEIMGINMPDNKFRPNDTVTRAEFVTALSRMKYNTSDGTDVYYSTHMKLLNRLGIITNTDPVMKELRGYVMLMLMRAK